MNCPHCNAKNWKVLFTKSTTNMLWRRRECKQCGARWSTHEMIDAGGVPQDGQSILIEARKGDGLVYIQAWNVRIDMDQEVASNVIQRIKIAGRKLGWQWPDDEQTR